MADSGDSMESLMLADQGYHEMEVSCTMTEEVLPGEEDDLKSKNLLCQKNPGHKEFILAKEFKMEDLPESFRDPRIFQTIKIQVDMTARLTVGYVSLDRPSDYPFSKFNGTVSKRFGSGSAIFVDMEDVTNGIPCPFPDCKVLPHPHTVSGFFNMFTALHVVYDDSEAEKTKIEFFFDDDKDTSGVATARGVNLRFRDPGGDRCWIKCVTHDPTLIPKLTEISEESIPTYGQMVQKKYDDDIAIVVSHPHGCAKQISLGKCVAQMPGMEKLVGFKFNYTAATCKGSSGAPVMIIKDDMYLAPHSGNYKNVNGSGENWW